MDAAFVENVIESGLPGAYANASLEGRHLRLEVACDARNTREAHKRIYDVLNNAGMSESFHAVSLRWYPNQEKLIKTKIKDIVGTAIRTISQNSYDYFIEIYDPDIAGRTLNIRVSSMRFSSPTTLNEARQRILLVSPELKSIADVDRISIHLDDGHPSYPQHGPCEDDDGCDGDNPNWPSTTGNPSGNGRGNNPPRR